MYLPCVDLGGYRSFKYNLNGYYHLGHDFNAPEGTTVNSITNGIVIFAGQVGGFGSHGNFGGVVIIKHVNSSGKEFIALYGHINYNVKIGDQLKQNEKIGTIIKYQTNKFRADHLHFAINTNIDLPDFPWGYSKYINGWVDPIKYIKNNIN